MDNLFKKYPQYFQNKNIIGFSAYEVFGKIPSTYYCEEVIIKSNEPFINIIFSKNQTLIAIGVLSYKLSTKDEYHDVEKYEVYINNEKIDHITFVNAVFEKSDISLIEKKLQEKNEIIIKCNDSEQWPYIEAVIPFVIEDENDCYKKLKEEMNKWKR